jgi:hypothetical protein
MPQQDDTRMWRLNVNTRLSGDVIAELQSIADLLSSDDGTIPEPLATMIESLPTTQTLPPPADPPQDA